MRRAAKVDVNHGLIRDDFRRMGFHVVDTSRMGKGFPDLLISRSFITAAIEIKRDKKAKLTDDQMEFHRVFKGLIFVVTDTEGAINVNQIMLKEAEYRQKGFEYSAKLGAYA